MPDSPLSSPRRRPASTPSNMRWWLELYNKACSLELVRLSYPQVRKMLRADDIPNELDFGDQLPQIQGTAPRGFQLLLSSLTELCNQAAIPNESVRMLFSGAGRDLKPVLYVAIKLKPSKVDPDSSVTLQSAGVLTVCQFTEEEGLATMGVAGVLEAQQLDPERCLLVDVVCSAAKSRSGRSLLAQLIVDLQRKRTRPVESLATIAVSESGRRLFESFGFQKATHEGDTVMFCRLSDITLETFTDSALLIGDGGTVLDMCFQPGLSEKTKHKMYKRGCL